MPGHEQPTATLRNERGIALIIVLIIVALLTITVTEFTYSVQLDQHRVRNSIHALQAALLARSGVNLAEGFLVEDDEPAYDAFTEQWWLDLNEFCRGVELDPTMRIRCRVQDESGKINVNLTRVTGAGRRRSQQQQVTRDAILRDALRRLFEAHNIDVELVDRLVEHWQQEPAELPNGMRVPIADFTSLESFGATLGISTPQLRELRNSLTAEPRGFLRGININTAPAEVLAAVLNDASAVAQILDRQQQEEPFTNGGEINDVLPDVEYRNALRSLFTVNSRLFRLEASALTNVDPADPYGGGIGQTVSELVYRRPALGLRRDDSDGPRWTLQPLDWQKEGGARLFWQTEADADRTATPGATDARDMNSFDR
jgi:type II secretory pathway component PulK